MSTALMMQSIANENAIRADASRRMGDAITGFYDTQGDIAKLGVQRALQDNTIRGRWNQAMALAAIRSNYANAVATKQATMARERDNTATLRQLAMKGFPVDPKISVEENIGNAAKWAEKKEGEAVDSAAANLQRFDDDEASLQEQLDATQSALESDRSKYIAGKTKEAFTAQFSPEQIAEISKQIESRPARSRPVSFEVAAANYAASKKLANILPLNQIEASVSDEFDTMKDNPIVARHTMQARQIASALQKNRNERSDFLQYSPHARSALVKRGSSKPSRQAAMTLDIGGDVGGVVEGANPNAAAPTRAVPFGPGDVMAPTQEEIAQGRQRSKARRQVYSMPSDRVRALLSPGVASGQGGTGWFGLQSMGDVRARAELGDDEYLRQVLLSQAARNPSMLQPLNIAPPVVTALPWERNQMIAPRTTDEGFLTGGME